MLKDMYKILGRGSTSDYQLDRVGKRLFKTKWLGVHPVNVKPSIVMSKIHAVDRSAQQNKIKGNGMYYGIINVDHSNEPGSHWLSIIYDKSQDTWYIWDSFARKSTRLIPKFIRTIGYKYIDLNKKSNQLDSQDDCGQRSLALMLYIAKHGIQSAHLI